jgi:hypothetical protein
MGLLTVQPYPGYCHLNRLRSKYCLLTAGTNLLMTQIPQYIVITCTGGLVTLLSRVWKVRSSNLNRAFVIITEVYRDFSQPLEINDQIIP